jgi:hypothetical protein
MATSRIISSILTVLAFLALGASAQTPLSPAEKQIITEFERRAQGYHSLRERLERRLPKLSDDSTPLQIEAHKNAFQKSVQTARRRAKRGELFTRPASVLIRRLIKGEFNGFERSELRKTVLEADTKLVALKVNVAYPESQELVEMPPQLLLALPQLPRALRFRFVGRNLVILDRENALIIDFMRNALP